MIVALTGSASFLGQNLVGLFEDDPQIERIISLDVRPPVTAGPKTRHVPTDLTTPGIDGLLAEVLADEKVNVLLHLAFLAEASHAEAWAHELEAVGTMHVVNAARRANVPKVIGWSQTLLYGAHPTNPSFLTEKHPLRARKSAAFFADKLEAEEELRRFGEEPNRQVVVLRTAPILGPTVRNYVTRYLSHRLVPTAMGFDPLFQFLHEVDAVAAFRAALKRDVRGVFNIVGDGVLPLSRVIHLAGRIALPVPHPLAGGALSALWLTQMTSLPAPFVDYLRYVCVADGDKAKSALGFRPAHSTREAILDFANAQRLRDLSLLSDTP